MSEILNSLPLHVHTPAEVAWVFGVVGVASLSAALALEAPLRDLETAEMVALLLAQFPQVLRHIIALYTRMTRHRVHQL